MLDFIQMFGILIISVMVISLIIKLFKQPIILGYVLAGLIFSLVVVANETMTESVVVFSEIGITFLLFLMGLEFDLKSLKYMGKDILIATLSQSIIFFSVGFGISKLMNMPTLESTYIGILFMFSSTLLAAKWVDDKKETGDLWGKATLGMLIIQDVLAILIMTVMSVVKESSLIKIAMIPFEGLILLLLAFILAKYALNIPLKIASRYPELLFLVSIGVCFLFVVIAPILGYSSTIGAFIGGVVLANTLYKSEILTRLKPLVTFFNMLFFVGLGFQMKIGSDQRMLIIIGILCLLSILLKPAIIYFTLRMRGYDMKSSFLSGTYLSQMSEFGIIILAGGVSNGMISGEIGSAAIIAVIASMILSSYIIKYDKKIFKMLEPKLTLINKIFRTKDIQDTPSNPGCEVIFFGYYELDRELLAKYKEKGKKVAVIENDPEYRAMLDEEGIRCIYGSINNPDFFEHVNFSKVEVAVSSRTDVDENKMIIQEVKKENPKAVVIVTAKRLKDAMTFYKHNADYVIYTDFLNEKKVSHILNDSITDLKKVVDEKIFDMGKFKEKEERSKKIREKNGFRELKNVFNYKQKKLDKEEKKKNLEKDNLEEKEKREKKPPEEVRDEVLEYLERMRYGLRD